jgi:hypothetical protein
VLVFGSLLGSGWWATAARADGDPASDVLATQNLFLPQDAGFSAAQQQQLEQLLREAAGSGYELRVAVIASPADLGSVTALWRQPATYARFLGQELSLTYHGTLLVVMTNGYGVSEQGNPVASAGSTLRALSAPGSVSALATAAVQASRRLAASAGHPLSLPAATAPGASRPSNRLAWIVFAAGLLVITAAWVASLRARPLLVGRRSPPRQSGGGARGSPGDPCGPR